MSRRDGGTTKRLVAVVLSEQDIDELTPTYEVAYALYEAHALALPTLEEASPQDFEGLGEEALTQMLDAHIEWVNKLTAARQRIVDELAKRNPTPKKGTDWSRMPEEK